ncbi:hypothetical protein H6F86_31260 [Phormidium sp. FACHB-592]|uniref:Uncharacterized protein n=1 Tax=Stenomitos frigidus AS-A4 TaxID=2933935 RepID=A0ABV0KRK9_9CYAN|nr:hypothetical protein [Phormidium sp. FACHB-592]MBD2078288.1 hypothetical protein [Phormidium sp. FACHB-592]
MSPDSQQQYERLTVHKAKNPIALTGLIGSDVLLDCISTPNSSFLLYANTLVDYGL